MYEIEKDVPAPGLNESDLDDERCWWFETEAEFRAALAEERRLLALFPGFTLAQIMAGLTVPACEETKE